MGFLKVSEKESKNEKKPHISIDQANYLKLFFHCHVLKFLWCKKRDYFDWEYSPGSFLVQVPWRPGFPFGNWSAVYRTCLFAMRPAKSRCENWTPLGLRRFCCRQVGDQLKFLFCWNGNSKYNITSVVILCPLPDPNSMSSIFASNSYNVNFLLTSHGSEGQRKLFAHLAWL